MSDKSPTLLTVDSRLSGIRFSRRVYLPRITGTLLCSLFIASVLVTNTTPFWVWALLFLNVFVWPYLAYYLSTRSSDPMCFERGNLLVDVIFGGFWIGMMGLNLLPSIVIIAMVGMNNMAGGGIRLFIKGISLQLLSAALVAGLNVHRIDLITTPTQLYACLPMLLVYPIALGYVTYVTATKLAEHKRRLMLMSTHDGMTNVYNRHHWEQLLHNEYEICRHIDEPSTLVLIDIDHFKTINDSFGHNVGDEAILFLTEELRNGLRATDVIGRFGGDEFAVILPEARATDAVEIINRIRTRLAAKRLTQTPQLGIRISVGVAEYRPTMNQYHDWLKAADIALYMAKNKGRGRTEVA